MSVVVTPIPRAGGVARGGTAADDARRGEASSLSDLQRSALRAARLLKAMSNPARLVILCQLADGERSVGDLERAVGLSQSGISQHLAVLRRERVVSYRRVRQTVLYALASRDVVALMATLHAVFCGSGAKKKRVTPG
ncbi:MAG TPA: metalloregulator ArsR/SmtB family transcription factor [Casimicrobiaceae bacterium]